MDTLEKLLSYLDRIQGMSAVGLVFLSCIVIGYIWRFIKWKACPNEAIPVIVIIWGAFAMSMLADARSAGMPMRVWMLRNVIVGAFIGFVAWLAHNLLIKRVEDWIQAQIPSLSATSFFSKGKPVDQPPTDNTPKP